MCACQKKTKSPTAAQIINFVGGILKFVLVVFSCKLRFRCGNTPPCVADFVGKPQVFHTFLYVYRVNPYPPYPKAIDTFFQPLKPIQKPLSNHSFCTFGWFIPHPKVPLGPVLQVLQVLPELPILRWGLGMRRLEVGDGDGYHFIPFHPRLTG